MTNQRATLHTFAFSILSLCLASVSEAEAPQGVLLTLRAENAEQPVASYTFDDLSQMPRISFETATRWTEGTLRFTGVSLYQLLHDAGIYSSDGVVTATAINDYHVDIPMASLQPDAPIVAFLIDGEPFPVRRNGPLWVVYPYDRSTDLRQEAIYGRSIWQLHELAVGAN